jgi:hypothetical protein
MVIVQITGGLGNQLFMYAAARRLALHHRTALKLDISAFESYPLRRYLLDRYCIAQDVATPDECAELKARALAQASPRFGMRSLFRRRAQAAVFSADDSLAGTWLPEILRTPADVYLQGYWQSEQYFKPVEQLIRDELRLKRELAGENLALAQKIGAVEAVSVHVRRGDYASNPQLGTMLGLLPPEYYQRASRAIAEAHPSARFFVFSDDPDWARHNLRLEHPVHCVAHNGPEAPHEDRRLMSRCRHHIVANSSLSWWGAWLCANTEKIVVAPAQWFQRLPMPDLVPQGWLRL